MASYSANDSLDKKQRSNGLALFMIAILGVMLIPMPPAILDVLLTVNISLSLLIMISAFDV